LVSEAKDENKPIEQESQDLNIIDPSSQKENSGAEDEIKDEVSDFSSIVPT